MAGLTSVIVNQKFDILATKAKDYKLMKMVLQMVSIHMSRQFCHWHSLHVSKSLSIIRQNMAVEAEHNDKLYK